MFTLEDIGSYRCPRWETLPDIELYMDQVMSVLDKHLSLFIGDDPQRAVTPTMINNYVKQKLVRPPKNKKYDKGHIVNFYIITLLKQIMSLGQIRNGIEFVLGSYSPREGYERFCEIFEYSLGLVFFQKQEHLTESEHTEADAVIRSICLAYANMLYARYLLPEVETKPVKEKKEKKKKSEDKENKDE